MVVRAVKHQYFTEHCILRMPSGGPFLGCPFPPGSGGWSDLLQGWAEEYIQHLMDKVTQIHSQLDPMHRDSPCEMLMEIICPVIWEWFDPVGPDEMDRTLDAVSTTTCQIDPCPSWMKKSSSMVTSRWVQALINTSLEEENF